MKYDKFCIQSGNKGIHREKRAVDEFARRENIEQKHSQAAISGMIPVGSLTFCESIDYLNVVPKTFYPTSLFPYLRRQIDFLYIPNDYIHHGEPKFFKDALVWKGNRESRPIFSGESVPEGCYWVSNVVQFTYEWRYYVHDGIVVTTGQYMGEEDVPAPSLVDEDIEIPDGYNGALDFGRLSSGELALIEAHAPFACGWYGETKDDYWYGWWQYNAFRGYMEQLNRS